MGLHFRLDNGEDFTLTSEEVANLKRDDAIRRISIREGKRFADLMSIWADLDMAVTVLDRLIAIRESPDRDADPVLEHAYWTTAVIHYTRCFTEGHRFRGVTPQLINDRLPEYGRMHRWIWNMRNKHVAHDENPYQQYIPSVVVHRAPDRTFASPNVWAQGIIAIDADRARAFRALVVGVGEIVKERLEAARNKFVQAIAAMPLSDVEALPPIEYVTPSIEDAGRSR
jgi:hypothetical protein